MAAVTYQATNTWICPAGVTSVTIECWGGGGAGGGASSTSTGGPGGGGGAYSTSVITVVPGTAYTVTVGAGGVGIAAGSGNAGGDSWFNTNTTILAKGGAGGTFNSTTGAGAGGAAASGIGTTKFNGGAGGNPTATVSGPGAGGGGGAGNAADGSVGGNASGSTPGAGGPGGVNGGGAGGAGSATATGVNGISPGGGGGGSSTTAANRVGATGGAGQIIITWADTPGYPNLIMAYEVVSNLTSKASLISPIFTPANGEIIVVKTITATLDTPAIDAVSGGGQTFTSQIYTRATGRPEVRVNTAVISGSPTNMSVTQAFIDGNGARSMVVERWRNAKLAGTPATASTQGTGAPSTTITTVANNSMVSWANSDAAAKDPATRVYRSSAQDDGANFVAGGHTAYYAFQIATTAGSQTFGLTAPVAQTYTLVAIELQYNAPTGGITFLPYKPPFLK